MRDIAICGFGGFAREIACLITIINKQSPTWNFKGFFVNDLPKGTFTKYGPILGNDSDLNSWENQLSVVIAIGNPHIVKKVSEQLTNPLLEFPNIIHPDVYFADKESFNIGKGNIIQKDCYISCDVTIGDFNILNGFTPIGHDTSIGNYNVIMPSCNISGGIVMGDCNFMGVKSVVLQYLKIGNNVRIGAGSVLMRHSKDGFLYVGIPAEKIEI